MIWETDPLLLTVFTSCIALLGWLFYVMDIQNASRALWTACEHLKDRVKQSATPFMHKDANPRGEQAENSQRLANRSPWSSTDTLDADAGHFTEREFLQRFGGTALPAAVQLSRESVSVRAHAQPRLSPRVPGCSHICLLHLVNSLYSPGTVAPWTAVLHTTSRNSGSLRHCASQASRKLDRCSRLDP